MSFVIFDQDDNQRDETWLREKFGNLKFHDGGSGLKFKLMRVDITEGPALIKVRVLDKDGAPLSNQPVANRWPDPNLQSLQGGGLKSLWFDRAKVQNTDNDGFTGFGLGTGSYIKDFANGGPHTIWGLSPSLPSDGLEGIGMLGGTNHVGPLFLTFQIVDEDTVIEPEVGNGSESGSTEGGEVSGDVMAKLDAIQADLKKLMKHMGLK